MPSSQFASLFARSAVPVHERVFGVTVEYTDTTNTSSKFVARQRAVTSVSTDGLAFGTSGSEKVFILPRAECVLAGTETKPSAGDRILEYDLTGALADTWEIRKPSDGLLAVEPDHKGHDWVCHAFKVA